MCITPIWNNFHQVHSKSQIIYSKFKQCSNGQQFKIPPMSPNRTMTYHLKSLNTKNTMIYDVLYMYNTCNIQNVHYMYIELRTKASDYIHVILCV